MTTREMCAVLTVLQNENSEGQFAPTFARNLLERSEKLDLSSRFWHHRETEFQHSVSSSIFGRWRFDVSMTNASDLQRVAFSPGEFAKLFGKSQTWGYRQIYSGKVKAITEHGRILIPAAEVDAILKTAGVYDGLKAKLAKSKAEIQKLAPRLQNAWQSFLATRRQSPAKVKTAVVAATPKAKWPVPPAGRQAALARLTRKPKIKTKARQAAIGANDTF